MGQCDKCKYPYDIRKWPCEDCLQGDRFEPKPLTNADRINAMTVEEKAEWLANISSCCEYGECPAKDVGDDPLGFVKCSFDANSCQEAWLDWLKQEADE